MRPPRPFPPWWHCRVDCFPAWVQSSEALAYGDLALLRDKWRHRQQVRAARPWYARLWAWMRGAQ